MKILNSPFAALFIFAFCWTSAFGQTAKARAKTDQPQQPVRGSITVRVLADDGQPLDNASVRLERIAAQSYSPETFVRGKDGEFVFENLKPGIYRVRALAPGYVLRVEEAENSGANRYRIGDAATLRLARGGVITGTVTDTDGAPLVEARVRVARVRNAAEQTISPQSDSLAGERMLFETWTDDRGVYRAFGLPAGAYLVSIGDGMGRSYSFGSVEPASGTATYHPSDPVDTAKEIFVGYGQEASGTDIQHRGGAGNTLSGAVSGAQRAATRFGNAVQIFLARAGSGQIEASTGAQEENGNFNFKLEPVADGEYLIQAAQYGEVGGAFAASEPQTIRIAGAEVSGLQLRLHPFGAIAGKVVFAPDVKLENKPDCRTQRRFAPEEIELILRREEKTDQTPSIYPRLVSGFTAMPDESGAFELRAFGAAKYRLTAGLPSENLFVRSLLAGAATGATGRDYGRDGVSASAKDLILTISDGAARLSGKVKIAAETAKDAPDAAPPALVHLVPAEKAAADDALRYFEVSTEPNGYFAFANVAPGKYFLLAQRVEIDRDKPLAFRPPVAWNAEKRHALRRSAEADKTEIELAPCQTIADREVVSFQK